jgi:hypothetical protein
MAVELERIEFKDFQEPAVGAENLNKLQDNTQNALDKKQDTLTAGDNITIEEGVISSKGTTYTAGENITIENGVISSSGGTASVETMITSGTGTVTVSASNNAINKIELTNPGYMPIGVAGFNTGNKSLSCFRIYIESAEEGKCTVNMATYGMSGVSNVTITAYVSWLKII